MINIHQTPGKKLFKFLSHPSLVILLGSMLLVTPDIRPQEVIQLGPDTLGLDDTTTFKPLTQSLLGQNLTPDMPIVRALDSVANIMFFQDHYLLQEKEVANIYQFPVDEIPHYSDSVIASRIAELNRLTPFELIYNEHVKSFIELYAIKKRALTSRMLGLSAIYFPMFDEMLDKYYLPLELKYLAVVESALNPSAVSRAGARGLWQFMYNTGKLYGLRSNSLVDDRSDPYKATDAACRHLRDLYQLYGNWSLALAAYNSGAGNVNKAIRRAGGVKSYWAIWPYLPRETRGYVPAFIAVNYIMSYSAEHNLYPLDPGILNGGIDTIEVKDALAFDQISEFLSIPTDQIRFLNPAYKEGIIPAKADKHYVLRLPREKIADFINNETALYQYKTQKGIEREKLLATIKAASERSVHIVKSGESLGIIARKYHCRVSDIKKWNGLKKDFIRKGQRLVVYPAGAEPSVTKKTVAVAKTEKQAPKTEVKSTDTVSKKILADQKQTDSLKAENTASASVTKQPTLTNHIVKKGETLGLIANKYGTTVKNLMDDNNLKSSKLKIGQKLVIKTNFSKTDNKKVNYKYYTVKQGDTLYKIAESVAKMTVEELKKINSITSETALKVGQKIIIGITN